MGHNSSPLHGVSIEMCFTEYLLKNTFLNTSSGLAIHNLWVRAGSSFRDRGGIVYSVTSNIVHPEFNWQTLEYDVAMLRTSEEILNVKPIALDGVNCGPLTVVDGEMLTVSGFGETLDWTVKDPEVLRFVEVPKMSLDKCKELYKDFFAVTESMFCAGFLDGQRDACQGDSGSALFAEQGQEKRCAVGVVSWGRGCAEQRSPGVYARILAAADFIQENMKI